MNSLWLHSTWGLVVLACFSLHLPGLARAAMPVQQLEALQFDVPKNRLPAPGFELQTLDGDTVRLEDLRGKLVVLSFWATFCKPCRDELPSMVRLQNRFRDQDLVILAVAVDRGDRKWVEAFVREYAIDLPVPLDPAGAVRNRYEVSVLPTSYLIGRDGRFIGRALGERDWSSPESMSLFVNLLSSGF